MAIKPKVLRDNGNNVVGFQYGTKTVVVKATKKIKTTLKRRKKVKAQQAKARRLNGKRRH